MSADSLVETNQNLVREVSPGIFQIGQVRLNKQERSVVIPVAVNMRTGAVEYLLVNRNGKTHESVLRTDAEPYHVHLAMLLLGAKGRGTTSFPANKTQPPPGDPIQITLVSHSEALPKPLRAERLVFDRSTGKSMQDLRWIYNGSLTDADGFAAQQSGSIVSLIDDPDALVNNPLPLRADDDNWLVAEESVRAIHSSAELVFTLGKSEAKKDTPSAP